MKKIFYLLAVILLLSLTVSTLTVVSYAEGEQPIETEQAETPKTVSETVVQWCTDNANNIFSCATLIGSLILAFAYKKGFLPSLSMGLSNISQKVGNGVDNLTAITNAMSQTNDETLKKIASAIAPALEKANQSADIAKNLSERAEDLQKQLDNANTEREVTAQIMKMQSEMFYGFFMSVNLPQYQKDQLGQKYADMQKVISALYKTDTQKGEAVKE